MARLLQHLKYTLIALTAVCFAVTTTYVPQDFTKPVERVYAQATVFDPINYIQNTWQRISSTLAANFSGITAGLTQQNWFKEFVLDKLAWTLAKNTLSMMTRSIVKWINSGFQGSPAFIQDLGGFLTNVADQTVGQFIQEYGGPLSIACSPFRLNIQIALSSTYNKLRDPYARRCTLTGVMQNIQNFTAGDMTQGGWASWLQIVHRPQQYSQYGAVLEATLETGITIRNAQMQQTVTLNWGSGFLSSVFCSTPSTPAVYGPPAPGTVQTPSANCPITNPGRVIENALTFQLSTGPQALIAADEINEIIGALLGQLMTRVVTGAGGLLGASSGNRYSDPTFNVDLYEPGMEVVVDLGVGRQTIADALAVEVEYASLAQSIIDRYQNSYTTDPAVQTRADTAYNEARAALAEAQNNALRLQQILTAYDLASTDTSRQQALQDYLAVSGSFNTRAEVTNAAERWGFGLSGMIDRPRSSFEVATLTAAIGQENAYLDLIDAAMMVYASITSPTADEDEAYEELVDERTSTQENIIVLQELVIDYNSAVTTAEREAVEQEFSELQPDLHSEDDLSEARDRWEEVFGPLP